MESAARARIDEAIDAAHARPGLDAGTDPLADYGAYAPGGTVPG
jgi:hypothetical protein